MLQIIKIKKINFNIKTIYYEYKVKNHLIGEIVRLLYVCIKASR